MTAQSKVKARSAVYIALRAGRISKPDACSVCGDNAKLHAHHDDHAKPLDVRWVCSPCHSRIHGWSPPVDGEKRTIANARLPEDALAKVDIVAEALGWTRSQLIAFYVEKGLRLEKRVRL